VFCASVVDTSIMVFVVVALVVIEDRVEAVRLVSVLVWLVPE